MVIPPDQWDEILVGIAAVLSAIGIPTLWTVIRNRKATQEIQEQFAPNGGSSIRDQINALTEAVDRIGKTAGRIDERQCHFQDRAENRFDKLDEKIACLTRGQDQMRTEIDREHEAREALSIRASEDRQRASEDRRVNEQRWQEREIDRGKLLQIFERFPDNDSCLLQAAAEHGHCSECPANETCMFTRKAEQ